MTVKVQIHNAREASAIAGAAMRLHIPVTARKGGSNADATSLLGLLSLNLSDLSEPVTLHADSSRIPAWKEAEFMTAVNDYIAE